MQRKLDYALIGPGLCITATSYGLCRYAYGLFIPIFRDAFDLSDAALAYIASISYASYFLVTLLGIYISSRLDPRTSLLWGGVTAVVGMLVIGVASTPLMLAVGVAIAGVTPGLAYTPISELVMVFVRENRQRNIYAIINSGTSLGVLLSGPVALFLEDDWRWSWAGFAAFALLSTLWCAWVIPKLPSRSSPADQGLNRESRPTGLKRFLSPAQLLRPERLRLFGIAFLIGIATSVYWTFSVDLITTTTSQEFEIFDFVLSSERIAQIFWMIVGISGFGGMFAGKVVNRLGIVFAMVLFQVGISVATLLLASVDHLAAFITSALIFGAFFVFVAATLGMWSMSLFQESPSVGFGLTFLLLSAGQFVGPVLTANLVEDIGLKGVFYLSAFIAGSIVLLLPLKQRSKVQA